MRPRPRFRRRASRTWLASILAGLAAAGIAARHIPAAGGSVPPPPPGTLQSLASGKCADLPA